MAKRGAGARGGAGPSRAECMFDELGKREFEKRGSPKGVFGYPAGKSVIADRLVKLFPPHETYVEPFCGSAALFFTKERSPVEVLNDLDVEVADMMKAIQGISDADLVKLEKMDWVCSEATWKALRDSSPTNHLETIHKFLYLYRFSYGRQRGKSFNADAVGATGKLWKKVEKGRDRLQGVKIFSRDYADVVSEYDSKDTFFFLDPPYVGFNAGVGESKFDETSFRKVLEGIKGKFLVTCGTRGELNTSGFNVQRMRQERQLRMQGASATKTITNLLVSNYKVMAKSLGPGVTLDEIVGVLDVGGGTRRVSVSGGLDVVKRDHANTDPLKAYPSSAEPVPVDVRVYMAKGVLVADLAVSEDVGWSFNVQRGDVPEDVPGLREVAKSFSSFGSRHFGAMRFGVPASPTIDPSGAAIVFKVDHADLEFGLQLEDTHEYFLTKAADVAGVLRIERVSGEWVAKLDRDLFPSVLKFGAPMPPEGVSALPRSLERVVSPEFRYWEARGEEARKRRDALTSSEFFTPENVKLVDGDMCLIVQKFDLYEPAGELEANGDWSIRKIESFLPAGVELVEVFSPDRVLLEKHARRSRATFTDVGDAGDGVLDSVVKILERHRGHFSICAIDSTLARAALSKLGRPFRFRPGDGVSVDAVKRLFVASFPVRSNAVEWIDALEKAHAKDRCMLCASAPDVFVKWADGRANAWFCNKDFARWKEEGERGKEKPGWLPRAIVSVKPFDPNKVTKTSIEERIMRRLVERVRQSDGSVDLGELAGEEQRLLGMSKIDRAIDHVLEKSIRIHKASEELRYALGIVLEPETEDSQHDIYSAEEVRQAAHRFMEEFQNAGFMHEKIVNDKIKIVESYIAPVDFVVGGQPVKAGTWLMAVHYLDDEIWSQVKSGALTGFSIGGSANRTPAKKAALETREFQGIELKIDRPKGFVQHGVADDGTKWEREYKLDYGYIPKTQGGDGDQLDIFLGPNASAKTAYWITQTKKDGSFDEYKVMLGFDSAADAKKAYVDHVPVKFFGEMHEIGVEKIKALLGLEPSELQKAIARSEIVVS